MLEIVPRVFLLGLQEHVAIGDLLRALAAVEIEIVDALDARGVISVTERQSYILRVRELAKACGEAWLATEAGGAA